MTIKWKTLIKGAIWEAIGVVILSVSLWISTGDLAQASAVGIGYPLLRAILWYPFERLFKACVRRWHAKATPRDAGEAAENAIMNGDTDDGEEWLTEGDAECLK